MLGRVHPFQLVERRRPRLEIRQHPSKRRVLGGRDDGLEAGRPLRMRRAGVVAGEGFMRSEQNRHRRRRYRRGVTTRSEDLVPARIRPWPRPGQPAFAHLALGDHRQRPSVAQVEHWLAELAAAGYAGVRTGALEPGARRAFDAAGFHVAQRLALLSLSAPFDLPRRPTGPRLRPMRTDHDWEEAHRLDAAAFGGDWAFDAQALAEACSATPASRARLAVDRGGSPVGFAISGRSGRHGFLQRISVDPHDHRQGIGSTLVADGLRWLRRWRTTTVLVNTEVTNTAALALYHRFGFAVRPDELVVMERAL